MDKGLIFLSIFMFLLRSAYAFLDIPSVKTLYLYFEEIGPINRSDKLSVIIYHNSDNCIQCELYEPKITELAEYYKDYVRFYKYDCKRSSQYKVKLELYNILKICHDERILNLPTITLHRMHTDFLKPYKEDYEPVKIEGNTLKFTEIESIYMYIDGNLPSLRHIPNTLTELFKIFENDPVLVKILYFSDYLRTSRTLKFLSIKFKGRLEVL